MGGGKPLFYLPTVRNRRKEKKKREGEKERGERRGKRNLVLACDFYGFHTTLGTFIRFYLPLLRKKGKGEERWWMGVGDGRGGGPKRGEKRVEGG